jgi:hypothetical protein
MVHYLLLILISSSFANVELGKLDFKKARTLKVNKAGYVLKVKRISLKREKLSKWVEDKYFLAASSIQSHPTPYKGKISSEVGCQNQFKPERITFKLNGLVGGYKYYADDRFNQVTCYKGRLKYTAALLAYFCGGQSYTTKVFIAKEASRKIEDIIREIKCE